MIRYVPILLLLIFEIYTLVDCARTDASEIRNLPKWAWILIILIIGTFGPIAYWIAGRPRRNPGPNRGPQRRILPPDDDPDFLRSI